MTENKIIAIGDTHGRGVWKLITKKHKDAFKIIFIGDYFDSFNIPYEKQLQNFKEIIEFKKQNMDQVVLLFGNHDYHYIVEERYSGFQGEHWPEIAILFEENFDLFQMAFSYDDYLFTHAGVTKEWAKENTKEIWSKIASEINTLFKERLSAFKFNPNNPFDNTGDSITQSPIWVRPQALLIDKLNYWKQVVGHTRQEKINTKDDVTFIDVLDSRNQYLVIKNGEKFIHEIGNE